MGVALFFFFFLSLRSFSIFYNLLMSEQTAVRPAVPMNDEARFGWNTSPRLCCWLPDCFDYSTGAELSLIVNPPSLAQNHHHHHTTWDPAANEERGRRPHSHHSSSSSSSIIPPITFEGRGQGRTLRAERVSGGGAPSICILPTFFLLLLLLPLLSLRGLTLPFPFLAASSLPQSILTHPVYKTLSQLPDLCYLIRAWTSRLFWVWRKCG